MNPHRASPEQSETSVALTPRQEKRCLAAALSRLKDATRGDLVLAASLYAVNGLASALAFVERINRYRQWEPPPLPEGAILLPAAPRHFPSRESLLEWMTVHLPETDRCLIWSAWQERKDTHPVVYVGGVPFVAYWVAFEAKMGPVPRGMDVEPCDEYRCLNPGHLRLIPQGTELVQEGEEEPPT